MKKLLIALLTCSLLMVNPEAMAANARIGAICPTVNQFDESGSQLLVCEVIKKKKTWRKATSVERNLYMKEKNRLLREAALKILNDAKSAADKIVNDAKSAVDAAAKAAADKVIADAAALSAAAKAALDAATKEAIDAALKAAAEASVKSFLEEAAARAAADAAAENICKKTVNRLKVGMAYDMGGLGDLSFNDAAAIGLEVSRKKLCVTSEELTLSSGSDAEREDKLRTLAKNGYNPIIAVGFLYAGPLKKVAKDYPNIQFGIIDDASVDLLNVASLIFAEEQGAYLAGVAAALASKSGKVGFLGGVRIPLIQKFEAGFVAGAKATNKSIIIDSRYVSEFPDFSGFNDPAKARVIAKGMTDQGVDVIFAAAGGSGTGVFAAATDAAQIGKKVWTIGSDTDQYQTASSSEKLNMLTSSIKRIDVAVYDLVFSSVAGSSVNDVLDRQSGIYGRRYTVALEGMSLSRSGGYLEPFWNLIEAAQNAIKTGVVIVPTKPTTA